MERDLYSSRRKRRKTASPEPPLSEMTTIDRMRPVEVLNWDRQLELEAGKGRAPQGQATAGMLLDSRPAPATLHDATAEIKDSKRTKISPSVMTNKAEPTIEPNTVLNVAKTGIATPKKTLKINKNGKLISPDVTKAEVESTTPKKRRGRKPKVKVVPTVTVIKYGTDTETRRLLGEKIDGILNCKETSSRSGTPKKAPPKPIGPPKVTHPFFLGRSITKPQTTTPAAEETISEAQVSSSRAPKKTAVTPGKLKAESRREAPTVPTSAFGTAFRSIHMSKQTGLAEPPWPTMETAHVRNVGAGMLPPLQLSAQNLLKARKMKSNVLKTPQDEDIIARLTRQLEAPICNKDDGTPATDFEPPKDVRLPKRLMTTGVDIQEQVRNQVRTKLPNTAISADDSIGTHPAIRNLFLRIEHSLTPFDLGKCEVQSWVQKYAPKCASHLLQPGQEAATLHDWLSNLIVMAVGSKSDASKNTNESRKPPKKRRKKAVDGFVVDTDEEEEEEMVELENGPGYRQNNRDSTSLRRTRWTRNKNVVLVSGPHGCGKSAMVHAVAKELGFEVFEINSGSRRSGKDIQEKVGDMSENHLVNHERNETSSKDDFVVPEDTDSERHSTALQQDLESGRQGTMTSFFKSKGTGKAKPKAKKLLESRKAFTSSQGTLSVTQHQRKSQKQSLILFEEADILFEEDQQFWPYVTKLAAQSKRPIIVTCNDEAQIPTHELPLAAILRLAPPPVDLAADYMVVLAGLEGHILERDAVSALYQFRNYDLRASITELDLWCQMSVGDRKGGLEWMYQRWPAGEDVDEHGRILRVASQGTYQPGMGCLSHNLFASSNTIGFDKEEELIKEAWTDWEINPCHWTNYNGELRTATLTNFERLDALSEAISAADIYSRIDMPSYERHHEQLTDPSLPSLRDKERLSYTSAAPLIQVDHISDFLQFDTDIFIQSHLCIRRAYGGHYGPQSMDQYTVPITEECFTRAMLQHKHEARTKYIITRPDFSEAFDLLAYPPDTIPAMNTSYNLVPSSFDRTFRIVVEDVAPYVRSIVAHELALEAQRVRLGSLLSECGSRTKRQRTTRAARTALEGGNRQTKRKENWFDKELNRTLVMKTAGKEWASMNADAEIEVEETDRSDRALDSEPGTQEE
jgi:DNA polymerase III delta prime subunit